MKVITKLLLTLETNTETGETKLINKKLVETETKPKASNKILGGDTPSLKLNANNFALNQKACDLLKVSVGDTLYINYPKKDGIYVPVIGASSAFNVKSGNKLTKSLTVSYRGAANEKLSEFGANFELVESEREGIFYLKGDKIVEAKKENAIEIDDSFELDDLEDIDLNLEESLDVSTIDFTL